MKTRATCLLLALAAGCLPPDRGGRGAGLFAPSDAEDEQWYILAATFEGPDRISLTDDLAAALQRVPGIDRLRVRVIHEEDQSVIQYGPYRLDYDAAGQVILSPELRRDLSLIRRLAVAGQHPFLRALPRRAPSPPRGPPEWDLRNADCAYSLQIGVFYNTANFRERKTAAVEWVKDLRQRGYPAFYFHNEESGRSSVTVGCFDESAVIGEPQRRWPAEKTVVGPRVDYSREVAAMKEQEEFRYNLVNGAIESVGGTPQVSFLVRVPRRSTAAPAADAP